VQSIVYKPIGIIHSPFLRREGMPIQPTGAIGVKGRIEVEPELADGLRDLEGFSHLFLLYHFHLSEGYDLEVIPFLDTERHGVFATRAPRRPNSIGLSIVRLHNLEGTTLHIEDVDILDGTPLLDIKPYVPEFDQRKTERTGWLSNRTSPVAETRSDDRFK
jgi:tRNA (adenine37-N6)-methyltransferase